MDIKKAELIGKITKIVESTDPNRIGVKGKIVDETKNMFTILCKGKETRIQKTGNTFAFTSENKTVEIKGKSLLGRPEDRIKRKK